MTLACSKCGKALSRKRARLINAKLLCSACLFAPAIAAGAGTAETGTGSVRSTPERAEGIAHPKSQSELD